MLTRRRDSKNGSGRGHRVFILVLAPFLVAVAIGFLACNAASDAPSIPAADASLLPDTSTGASSLPDGGPVLSSNPDAAGSRDGNSSFGPDATGNADGGDDASTQPGSTPLEPLVPLPAQSGYPRVIQRANGTIVASVVTTQASGNPGGTILESTDDGLTFHVIGNIDDPGASDGLCCATLYELPRALGALPAGALLWSASVGWTQTTAPMHLPIWSSTNGGTTWSPLSTIVAGVVYSLHHGVWEPEFSMLDDGTLVCHFSDETDPAHSQKLAAVRTQDGVNWSASEDTVSLPTPGYRPGMANVRRGPSGVFFMSYEVCGVPGDSCTAHLRTSSDGWSWGDPTDIGLRPSTVDGKYFQHAPTLLWTSTPGEFGRLFLVGQVTFNAPGGVSVSTENGNFVMANAGDGTVPWYGIPAPVPVVPAPYDDSCPNYSSPLLALDNGTMALELASRYDGTDCRTYFAKGPLLGTGDAAGVQSGATYRLVNVQSGLCLDVAGGSTAAGGPIQQSTCSGLEEQNWTLAQASDGTFSLQAQNSGMCLAPAADAGPDTAGTQIAQAPCDGSGAQSWTLHNVGHGYYELLHAGGLCLDNAGGSSASGTNIQEWTCNDLSPQIWYLAEWTTRVFFGQDNNGAAGADWDPGYDKGDCGPGAAVTGLSQNTALTAAHALLCMTEDASFGDSTGAILPASGGDQLFSRAGDWDPGSWKVECALNQSISGMSMDPSTNAIHAVRCASNASLTNGGQNSCETHLVSQNDRGDTRSDEWDWGYFKAECSAGKIIYGVSLNVATAEPNRILCCDQ
jgi:hypothetical protein